MQNKLNGGNMKTFHRTPTTKVEGIQDVYKQVDMS